MGRGFGRGAKVTLVTHAQAGNKGKKTPKGLRGVRQRKRARHQGGADEQVALEQSLGIQQKQANTKKNLAQEIAGIQFAHCVNKRQKGFKQIRKQLMHAVKDVRRRYSEKGKKRNESETTALAVKYELEKKRRK